MIIYYMSAPAAGAAAAAQGPGYSAEGGAVDGGCSGWG